MRRSFVPFIIEVLLSIEYSDSKLSLWVMKLQPRDNAAFIATRYEVSTCRIDNHLRKGTFVFVYDYVALDATRDDDISILHQTWTRLAPLDKVCWSGNFLLIRLDSHGAFLRILSIYIFRSG
jgi:hypothetical protein